MFRAEEIDIRHYGVVLSRWRRLILIVAGSCMALAFVINLVLQPVYRATTRIEIAKEPTRSPITGQLVSDDYQSDAVAVRTAAELMTNRDLMQQVVNTLQERELLQMNAPRAEFFRRLRERLAIGHADPAAAVEGTPDEPTSSREVDWLLSVLQVRPIPETRLMKIQVDHWNPRVARAIADVVAAEFVEYQSNQRLAADTTRLGTLRTRIESTRLQIGDLEKQISSEAGMPVLEERVRQISGSMGGLNQAMVTAQTQRLELESRLARVRQFLADSSMGSGELPLSSPTLETLWRELLTSQTELARARQVFREKHPRLVMIETQMEAIRANIRAELVQTTAGMESRRSVLAANERSLRQEIASKEGQLRQVSGSIGQSSTIESQIKSKRDISDLLSARLEESEAVTAGMRLPMVRVVEPATVGSDPIRPRKALNLLLGLMVGLLAGTGLALLLEYLRRAIRTPSDVNEQLQLPVLGMIPKRPQ